MNKLCARLLVLKCLKITFKISANYCPTTAEEVCELHITCPILDTTPFLHVVVFLFFFFSWVIDFLIFRFRRFFKFCVVSQVIKMMCAGENPFWILWPHYHNYIILWCRAYNVNCKHTKLVHSFSTPCQDMPSYCLNISTWSPDLSTTVLTWERQDHG